MDSSFSQCSIRTDLGRRLRLVTSPQDGPVLCYVITQATLRRSKAVAQLLLSFMNQSEMSAPPSSRRKWRFPPNIVSFRTHPIRIPHGSFSPFPPWLFFSDDGSGMCTHPSLAFLLPCPCLQHRVCEQSPVFALLPEPLSWETLPSFSQALSHPSSLFPALR